MKSVLYLLPILWLMLCSCAHRDGQDERLVMLVGCYTDAGGQGVYSYRFDQETLEWELLDSVETAQASYLTWSPTCKTVYAVREVGGDEAAVVEIGMERGVFGRVRGVMPTLSGDPCYIATNGQLLLTANYGGGSMSVFGMDGEHVKACSQLFAGGAAGVDERRQGVPHVHASLFTPDGGYVMATDFSADRILTFRIDGDTLVACDTTQLPAGTAPRHLVFSPDGRYAYILGEISGTVTSCRYEAGRLEPFEEVHADSLGGQGSADIHISRDGRYLYASNRLKGDGIAIFSVSADGQLERVGYQATGVHPRHFAITPNGRYVLCACRDAGGIEIYSRDTLSGLMRATERKIPVKKPVFVGLVTAGFL